MYFCQFHIPILSLFLFAQYIFILCERYLVRWIDIKVLDYIIKKGLISEEIKDIFDQNKYSNKEFYRTRKGKLMWDNKSSKNRGTWIIKQSLNDLKTQKKDANINNQNLEIENNDTNMIKNNLGNPVANNFCKDNIPINTTEHLNYSVTDGSNINLNQRIRLKINNSSNKSNVAPNNKKTKICLGVVGFIFIIAGICLLFTAPKIAIIFLVIGGLLFIGAIGFNKFCLCLCFNKDQIANFEFEQKQSIDEQIDNLTKQVYSNNNEINNDNPIV